MQRQASSVQQSGEDDDDVVDCLPELIDYVDGQHQRLQALLGTTLTRTQIEQVSLRSKPHASIVHHAAVLTGRIVGLARPSVQSVHPISTSRDSKIKGMEKP